MKAFPKLLTIATVAALLFAASNVPGQSLPPSGFDLEASLAASPTIQAMKADIDALKSGSPMPMTTATKATSAKVVRKADGSAAVQVCTDTNDDGVPDSCREIPIEGTALQNVTATTTIAAPVAMSYPTMSYEAYTVGASYGYTAKTRRGGRGFFRRGAGACAGGG